jgi:AraC-like DNA-binding protein
MCELGAEGSDCVLSRVSEWLFVGVVRRYVPALPAENVGWFAGLRDESVGRGAPEAPAAAGAPLEPGALAEIAERVGYGSEAALSRAFKRWVGIAPAPYRRGELVSRSSTA